MFMHICTVQIHICEILQGRRCRSHKHLYSLRERQTSSVWAWAVWYSIHAELIQFSRREQAGETEKFLLSPSRTSQLHLTVSAFVFPKNRLTTTGLLCSTKLHRKCPALITTKACLSARAFIWYKQGKKPLNEKDIQCLCSLCVLSCDPGETLDHFGQ